MKNHLLAISLLLVACEQDTGHVVNVPEQYAFIMPRVVKAVDRLNDELSAPVYSIKETKTASRVDNQTVIRIVDKIKDGSYFGWTEKTLHGVKMELISSVTAVQIAHELGHAMGLNHVDDSHNLMYPTPSEWNLDQWQIDHITGVK